MRITETNFNSKIAPAKRKKGADKTSAFSDAMSATENEEVAQAPIVGNINSVLSVDSLGILTNLGNEEFVKKENIEWGKSILSTLEGIKYQILNGKVSYSSLIDLKQRLNNIPLNSTDYKLKQIVEEIETRAAVELEKFKKLSEQTQLFKELV